MAEATRSACDQNRLCHRPLFGTPRFIEESPSLPTVVGTTAAKLTFKDGGTSELIEIDDRRACLIRRLYEPTEEEYRGLLNGRNAKFSAISARLAQRQFLTKCNV